MSRANDLLGKTFGRLLVVKRSGCIGREAAWLCQCVCGKQKMVRGANLLRQATKSCGCLAKELSSQRRLGKTVDITGKKIGRLTALRILEYKNYEYIWLFRCDCGKEVVRIKRGVVSAESDTPSCGCYTKEVNTNRFSGESNPNWVDRSFIIKPVVIRSMSFYNEWRKNILKRDDYTCQMCLKRGGHYLEVDHIRPFSVIIIENKIDTLQKAMSCIELWDDNNARTLCHKCHTKTDSYGYNFNKLFGKRIYEKV